MTKKKPGNPPQDALRLPQVFRHARILARDDSVLAARPGVAVCPKTPIPAETLKLEYQNQQGELQLCP